MWLTFAPADGDSGRFQAACVSIYVCGTKNVTVYFFLERSSTSTGRLTLKLCVCSYWNRYEVILVVINQISFTGLVHSKDYYKQRSGGYVKKRHWGSFCMGSCVQRELVVGVSGLYGLCMLQGTGTAS